MNAPPGLARTPSTTVRLTEKKAHSEIGPALFRRTVDALAHVSGASVKTARQQVRAWVAGGAASSDLEAWLRQNFRVDPTGVTAVRNVSRERGNR